MSPGRSDVGAEGGVSGLRDGHDLVVAKNAPPCKAAPTRLITKPAGLRRIGRAAVWPRLGRRSPVDTGCDRVDRQTFW